MGYDDDQRKADYWFHRNRQLDWKDQQAATERQLEILRLRRHSSSSADTGEDSRPAEAKPSSSDLARELLSAHREIIERIRDAPIERWRSEKWLAQLARVDPLRPESRSAVEGLASEIEAFLKSTTDWELGRGSLGTGMVARDGLNLTHSMLVLLAVDIAHYWRSR